MKTIHSASSAPDNGKPAARLGRKTTDLKETAGLPKEAPMKTTARTFVFCLMVPTTLVGCYEGLEGPQNMTEEQVRLEIEDALSLEDTSRISGIVDPDVETAPPAVVDPLACNVAVYDNLQAYVGEGVMVRWELEGQAEEVAIDILDGEDMLVSTTRVANTGSHFLNLDTLYAGHYRLQVQAVRDEERVEECTVKVALLVIEPTAPPTACSIEMPRVYAAAAGESIEIEWTAVSDEKILFHLIGATDVELLGSAASEADYLEWTVPSDLTPGSYTLRATTGECQAHSQLTIIDDSEETPANCDLTTEHDVFVSRGNVAEIRWNASATTSEEMEIVLSNEDAVYRAFVLNTGEYGFSMPQDAPLGSYHVQVHASEGQCAAESNAPIVVITEEQREKIMESVVEMSKLHECRTRGVFVGRTSDSKKGYASDAVLYESGNAVTTMRGVFTTSTLGEQLFRGELRGEHVAKVQGTLEEGRFVAGFENEAGEPGALIGIVEQGVLLGSWSQCD